MFPIFVADSVKATDKQMNERDRHQLFIQKWHPAYRPGLPRPLIDLIVIGSADWIAINVETFSDGKWFLSLFAVAHPCGYW